MNEKLIQQLRGGLIILLGIILLLYNFGYFQKLGTTVLILLSLLLIVGGFFDAGFYKMMTKKP